MAKEIIRIRSIILLGIVVFTAILASASYLSRSNQFTDGAYSLQQSIPTNTNIYEILQNKTTEEKIAILTVLRLESDYSKYTTALLSVECYAAIHNYTFIVVYADKYSTICKHDSIMFKRHCIAAQILETSDYDWILFIDSDIGVVNPNKMIESYTSPVADILFYDRFFNFEVTSGTYLVRKSSWSIEFLRGWADYEYRLPNSFHGYDNGAIHAYLMERLIPSSPYSEICYDLWNKSTNYGTLGIFEACVRQIIKNVKNAHIIIMEKGTGWTRDGWLTNSRFSLERDFMFHGRKEIDKQTYNLSRDGTVSFYGVEYSVWYDHLRTPLNIFNCRNGDLDWDFDPLLTSTSDQINKILKNRRIDVDRRYRATVRSIGGGIANL